MEHVLELIADKELDWVEFDEKPGVLVGSAGTDEDGKVGEDFFAVFLGGFGMEQVNDGFFPAASLKNQGAPGVDGAHAKTHFDFHRVRCFDAELAFL